ncbi:MAG: hypothetical protein Q4D51_08060 [Eubacteriales bacterium]|nr:hypothetical protein [Eubacteriales bacterium]
MRIGNNTAVVMSIRNMKHQDNNKQQHRLEEAFANRTITQIQGTGKFTRSFGGDGTLQHIDALI